MKIGAVGAYGFLLASGCLLRPFQPFLEVNLPPRVLLLLPRLLLLLCKVDWPETHALLL